MKTTFETITNKDGEEVSSIEKIYNNSNELLLVRENKKTFYKTKEVDEIICKIFDKNEVMVEHFVIKHYTNGKQPDITIVFKNDKYVYPDLGENEDEVVSYLIENKYLDRDETLSDIKKVVEIDGELITK